MTQPYYAKTLVKLHVSHFIETTGPPTHAKARRLAPERLKLVKQEFESLMHQGIIRPSSSNWSSALHLAPKKNGDLRLCGDNLALNSRTIEDKYPFPIFRSSPLNSLVAASSPGSTSPDPVTHKQHLQEVLTRLQNYEVQINIDKSVFGVSSITFLGHTVTSHAAQLEEFLGMFGPQKLKTPLLQLKKPSLTFQHSVSHIRTPTLQSPQMLPALTLVQSFISTSTLVGNPSPFSLRNSARQNPNTSLMIENSLRSTKRSSIFAILWKVVNFTFTPTTNPSLPRFSATSPPSPHDSYVTLTSSRSSADALSRNISAVASCLINYATIAADQTADPELQELLSNPVFLFKKILLPGTGVHIYADSTETSRPFLPKDHRQPVFHKLDSLSHPGIRATHKMMTSCFIWPNINNDVRQWARTCVQCQRSKVFRHTRSLAATFAPVSSRFEHVHIDLILSLPLSSTPLSLTSDRGGQFESNVWNKLIDILRIQHIRTASYHPQANGTVEGFHRQLKVSLTASTQREDWSQALPLAIPGIRTSFKEDLQLSSAELVYGTILKLPGQPLAPAPNSTSCHLQDYTAKLTDHMSSLQPVQPRMPSFNTFISQDLDTCTHVFIRVDAVRKPLQQPYQGPFKVLRRTRKIITIEKNGMPDSVKIDRVKPVYLLREDTNIPHNKVADTSLATKTRVRKV
ncbi:uncharacterized protein LOC143025787 [Oratosquilla oratoria]|uniref:uncharacterized protein LOC143025787 n=1 Tax=Oratosquilla oratoria TaxID=337810 RepID=UPI003F7744BD